MNVFTLVPEGDGQGSEVAVVGVSNGVAESVVWVQVEGVGCLGVSDAQARYSFSPLSSISGEGDGLRITHRNSLTELNSDFYRYTVHETVQWQQKLNRYQAGNVPGTRLVMSRVPGW